MAHGVVYIFSHSLFFSRLQIDTKRLGVKGHSRCPSLIFRSVIGWRRFNRMVLFYLTITITVTKSWAIAITHNIGNSISIKN